jgi:hypothetical protein
MTTPLRSTAPQQVSATTLAASCRCKKPSMAFFHLGNARKRRGFSGLPLAASCGGRLVPESARLLAAMVAFVGLATTGCQVDVGGQTLPSAYYLQDDIQYFPAGPEFKLSKEAAAQKAYKKELGGSADGCEKCGGCGNCGG